jgi:hypothetical protein
MKVRIVYKAFLKNVTAAHYAGGYQGYWNHGLDIGRVMDAGAIQNVQRVTEDIEIGFYANSKIELVDSSGAVTYSFVATAGAAEPVTS